jgi:hypothetical protein
MTGDDFTIISGGQTGADRAALDFAIAHRIRHAGWCPKGRLAEDGPISSIYQLRETPSDRYAERTAWNIRDSDATIVFSIAAEVHGGTALTIQLAKRLSKPWLHLAQEHCDDRAGEPSTYLRKFLQQHKVARLNIAGPRQSRTPEIGEFVKQVLAATFLPGGLTPD